MRLRHWLLLSALLPAPVVAQPQVIHLDPDDPEAFNQLIAAGAVVGGLTIVVDGQMLLPPPPPGAPSYVPPIQGDVTLMGGAQPFLLLPDGPPGTNAPPVFLVGSGATLRLDGVVMQDFATGDSGGAILVDGGTLVASNAIFSGNSAAIEGGAIKVKRGKLRLRKSRFRRNSTGGLGGAISATDQAELLLVGNRFSENSAGVFGCDLNVATPGPTRHRIQGNAFEGGNCDNVLIENPMGVLEFLFNLMASGADPRAFDSTGEVDFLGNLLLGLPPSRTAGSKELCADFGSGAFRSLGANIASDASCALDGPGDLVTSQSVVTAGADGVAVPHAGSPALDRGPAGLVALPGQPSVLPCGYSDARGLGRPQDNDGDGLFECDSGSGELQAGADLGPAHSAAYYDTGRSGEGHIVELLGGGVAVASTFTFGPDGGMAWFTGLGQVVGNSVVIDDYLVTSGGRFGAAFDPGAVVRTRAGGASFVFPDCNATNSPGHFAFAADADGAFSDLAAAAARLTSVVPCSGPPAALAGRSGSFYPQGRSGEGLFLQFLPDGRAVMVFYSYTPAGEQFWAIASDVTVAGDVLTANLSYPVVTTRFGSAFDPADVTLAPWGTATLTFQGCDALSFAWNSTVPGYGSGSLPYTRLTQLDGTNCAD